MSFIIAQADTQFASSSAPFILIDITSTSTSSGLLSTLLAPHGPNTAQSREYATLFKPKYITERDREKCFLQQQRQQARHLAKEYVVGCTHFSPQPWHQQLARDSITHPTNFNLLRFNYKDTHLFYH
jgi:hypothetical protein